MKNVLGTYSWSFCQRLHGSCPWPEFRSPAAQSIDQKHTHTPIALYVRNELQAYTIQLVARITDDSNLRWFDFQMHIAH